MHLSDAEPFDPARPLWKLYKRKELFFDAEFMRCLRSVEEGHDGPTELVLNGDIFDFDNITELPEESDHPVDWLARQRGLTSEEWMSAFKMKRIINDHRGWFEEIGDFVRRGNRLVYVVGNHDIEVAWPKVQTLIREAMGFLDATPSKESVEFCSWFYISEEDTYISHGHQYDPYCSVPDPMHPFITISGRPLVRLPFGELAERYMLNGMGYFNPHATSNFIMSLPKYIRFFFKYMLRTQPLLIWSWFWGAVTTLILTFSHFLRPSIRDPLSVERRTREVAEASNATPQMVRELLAVSSPSACTNPIRIIRELWLDRALLLLAIIYGGVQFVATINLMWPVDPRWVFLPILLMSPFLFVYSYSVNSTVFQKPLLDEGLSKLLEKITGVRQVVFGHSHEPEESQVGSLRYFNSGFWSPAYAEPECINRIGVPTMVWIRPVKGEGLRRGGLYSWPPGSTEPDRVDPAKEGEGAPEASPPATGDQ